MAVTNQQYANNTYKVVISNELTTSNNVIDHVNTAITTLGWDAFDSVDETEYSPIVTRVYQAPNVDGTTFKYAIIKYDTLKLKINLSCAEDWNVATKSATNESWHADGCFYHGYDLRNSFIIVNATERHLLLQTWILNEAGHWAGIFEVERIAPEDIAANSVPCYFYTNSLMFGTPFGIEGNRFSNTSMVMMSFPRTPDGQTGEYAAAVYSPTTSRGMWPPYYPSGNTGNVGINSVFSTSNTDFNNLHLGSWHWNIGTGAVGNSRLTAVSSQGGVWGWDGTEIPMSPISVDATRKHMPFGRIFDMGITRPIGGQLETTYFTANTSGGWPDDTGSNTEFLLMPLNGGIEEYISNNYTSGSVVANSGIKVSWSNNMNTVYSTLTAVGENVWAAANNGIWVWNQNAGTNTAANLIYFNSNGVLDLMYDGRRSIYGTINTGMIQIDTETYASNLITSGPMVEQGGCAYLNMDNKYIYVTARSSNTRPHCHIISRSNNVVSSNTIQLAPGVALNVASGWNTPMPDYKGFVYLSNAPGSIGNQQKRMLVANVELGGGGVANSIQPWYTPTAHNASFEYDNIYLEPFANRLYHFQIASALGYVNEYDNTTQNFTLVANTVPAPFNLDFGVNAGGTSQLNYYHINNTLDLRGDLNIVQHRGMFHVQRRWPGRNVNAISFISRFILHHPFPNPSNTLRIPGLLSRVFVAANTLPGAVGAGATNLKFPSNYSYTNGIKMFQNYYISNSEVRIQVQGNYFPLHSIGGYPTSRLLIKA